MVLYLILVMIGAAAEMGSSHADAGLILLGSRRFRTVPRPEGPAALSAEYWVAAP